MNSVLNLVKEHTHGSYYIQQTVGTHNPMKSYNLNFLWEQRSPKELSSLPNIFQLINASDDLRCWSSVLFLSSFSSPVSLMEWKTSKLWSEVWHRLLNLELQKTEESKRKRGAGEENRIPRQQRVSRGRWRREVMSSVSTALSALPVWLQG